LKAYESVIERGQKTFVEVGEALRKIRDGRLYRQAGHATFADYCQARWAMKRAYAYSLIGASEVSAIADISTESQARELRKVPVAHRAEVMEQVRETGKPITAAVIRKVANGDYHQQEEEVAVAQPACCHCPVHCP
jgi:hypothetical protein